MMLNPFSKRAPIKRKTPLKAKRKYVPAAERRHMARVAKMPCLVTSDPVEGWLCDGMTTVHHVTASIHGGRISRSHRRVVPLCPAHHLIQHGPKTSVEALGHGGFYATYGIDLLAEADRLWRESDAS